MSVVNLADQRQMREVAKAIAAMEVRIAALATSNAELQMGLALCEQPAKARVVALAASQDALAGDSEAFERMRAAVSEHLWWIMTALHVEDRKPVNLAMALAMFLSDDRFVNIEGEMSARMAQLGRVKAAQDRVRGPGWVEYILTRDPVPVNLTVVPTEEEAPHE